MGVLCLCLLAWWVAPRWEPTQVWLLERTSLESLQKQASAPGADAWVHYYLGNALARRGQHSEAVQSFDKALNALNTRDNAALRVQVQGETARSLVALKEDSAAASYARRALEADVTNVPAHMAMIQILVNRKLYPVAIQELGVVTQLEPDYAEAWYALGQIHNLDRHPEKAEVALRKAIDLAPNVAEQWREIGDSFASRSRFDEAAKYFERALKLRPDDQNAAGKLARTRALQARTREEYHRARKGLMQFAQNGGGDAFFFGQIGILDAQFGDLPQAEATLTRAVALNPTYSEALYTLALTYRRLGRTREAEATMKKFQRIEQLNRYAHGLEKKLSLHPQDLALNLELGRTREAQGDVAEAMLQYRQVLMLAPNHRAATDSLRRLSGQTATQPQATQPPTLRR